MLQHNQRYAPLSFYPIYPTGRPVFYDDFEAALLSWSTALVGTGAAARINTDAYQGDACVQLTTGAAGADESEILKQIGRLPRRNGVGLEYVLKLDAFHTIGDLGYYQWGTEHRGDLVRSAYIHYDPDHGGVPMIRVRHLGGYVNAITFPAARPLGIAGTHKWYPWKLFVDFTNSRYIGLIFNDILLDLRQYSLYEWAGTETWCDYTGFFWLKNNTTAKAMDVEIDNVLLTYDEPSLEEIAQVLGVPIRTPPITLTAT